MARSNVHRWVRAGAWAMLATAICMSPALPQGAAAQDAETPGSLTVQTVNGEDEPVPGACYDVFIDDNGPAGFVAEQCDAYDGANDGSTTFADLPPGDYVLTQIAVSAGYRTGKARQIAILGGEDTRFTFRTPRGGQAVTVALADDNGQPLPGGCYRVYPDGGVPQPGPAPYVGCDFYDGNDDGLTTVAGIERGAHRIILSAPPQGYTIPVGQTIVVDATERTLDFAVERGGETLTIVQDDSSGSAIPGGCYALFAATETGATPAATDGSGGGVVAATASDPGALVAVTCDLQDGDGDGVTTVVGLLPGSYAVAQVLPAGAPAPATVPIAIVAGEAAELSITLPDAQATPTADATPTP